MCAAVSTIHDSIFFHPQYWIGYINCLTKYTCRIKVTRKLPTTAVMSVCYTTCSHIHNITNPFLFKYLFQTKLAAIFILIKTYVNYNLKGSLLSSSKTFQCTVMSLFCKFWRYNLTVAFSNLHLVLIYQSNRCQCWQLPTHTLHFNQLTQCASTLAVYSVFFAAL